MTQRIQRHAYLAIFDGPDPSASTAVRVMSTTFCNPLPVERPFVHKEGKQFAARIRALAVHERGRIDPANRFAFSRLATAAEVGAGPEYLRQAVGQLAGDPVQAWASYARGLFRLNEFVYVN